MFFDHKLARTLVFGFIAYGWLTIASILIFDEMMKYRVSEVELSCNNSLEELCSPCTKKKE